MENTRDISKKPLNKLAEEEKSIEKKLGELKKKEINFLNEIKNSKETLNIIENKYKFAEINKKSYKNRKKELESVINDSELFLPHTQKKIKKYESKLDNIHKIILDIKNGKDVSDKVEKFLFQEQLEAIWNILIIALISGVILYFIISINNWFGEVKREEKGLSTNLEEINNYHRTEEKDGEVEYKKLSEHKSGTNCAISHARKQFSQTYTDLSLYVNDDLTRYNYSKNILGVHGYLYGNFSSIQVKRNFSCIVPYSDDRELLCWKTTCSVTLP